MKYTRFEFKGQYNPDYRLVIRYLILIPMLGVLIGFIVFKFYISQYFLITDNQKAKEELLYLTVVPQKYYSVQCGVFSTPQNAESMVNIIKAANLPAFIYQDEKYYRVVVYTCYDYETANRKISDYKAAGLDYIIKEITVAAKDVPESYRTDNRYIVLSRVVDEVRKTVGSLVEETAKFEAKEIEYTAFNSNVKSMSMKINNAGGLLNSIHEGEDQTLIQAQKEFEYVKNILEGIGEAPPDLSIIEEKKFWCIQGYKRLAELFNSIQ